MFQDDSFISVPENLIYVPPPTFTRYTVRGFPTFDLSTIIDPSKQPAFRRFDTAPQSRIRTIATSDHRDYIRYQIEHDSWFEVLVRFRGEVVPRVKRIIIFNMYIQKGDPTRVWFQAQKPVAEEFLRRVDATQMGELSAIRNEINIVQLLKDYKDSGRAPEEILSGWFVRLKIRNLSTAFLDGVGVTQSKDWDRFFRRGELASIDIVKDYGGDTIRTIVTRRGTIVFRRKIAEGVALELLDDIAEKFAPYTEATTIKKGSGQFEEDEEDDNEEGIGDDENER